MEEKEKATGELFGRLFPAYDDELFNSSVKLLQDRFAENDFPLGWFVGKKCLDVGCGGGRYSLALSSLGVESVTGIDISKESISDARLRAIQLGIENVDFCVGSVTELPFEDESFDCVLFSGVLMHVANPIAALDELSRVVKSRGMLYLLVYATEGVRWPLIQMLRPICQSVGFERLDQAVAMSGLAANRRRTYLDDLFVPYIDFYSWQCLSNLLREKGFENLNRWQNGRLDHEEDLEAYLTDLKGFLSLFEAASEHNRDDLDLTDSLILAGRDLCEAVVGHATKIRNLVSHGSLPEEDGRQILIGQGHHRVVAWKH